MKIKYLFGFLILLIILECFCANGILIWRNYFWQSLANHDSHKFIFYIGIFSIIALISGYLNGKSQYLIKLIGLHYRTHYTSKALKMGFYKTLEGGNQRVQEDCMIYPQLKFQLIAGLLRSILVIISFGVTIILSVPFYYLVIISGYVLIGTLIASFIAKPLVNLNYLIQVKEAFFRKTLIEYNALEAGAIYKTVYMINTQLISKIKQLNYFQTFYNQITIIIPYLLLAKLYFTAILTFGLLMQLASGLTEIINQASYIINSYTDINTLIASRKRLKEVKIL